MTLPIANDSDGMQGDPSTKQSLSQTSWLSRSVERELEAKTYKMAPITLSSAMTT